MYALIMENLDLNVLILHNFLNKNYFLKIKGNGLEREIRVAVRELELLVRIVKKKHEII
jgi:hypothetical protein